MNQDEVEFITLLYHQLAMRYPELKSSSEVAVISPYRQQMKLLKDNFRLTFGDQSKEVIDVNTVDGFQVTSSFCEIRLKKLLLRMGFLYKSAGCLLI